MIQIISPNPNIPCKPGWCLAYVNEAFRVPKRYGTATAAWLGSATKHRDWDFPAGVWVPVWFLLATEPAGHVALRAPDGSVYSTTHPTATTPTHHPDMADLFRAYARYNPLTYLGWTEDVEDTPVVGPGSLSLAGTITPLEDEMLTEEQDRKLNSLVDLVSSLVDNVATKKDLPSRGQINFTEAALRSLVENVATKSDLSGVSAAVASAVGAKATTEEIRAAVEAGMSAGLKVDVTVGGSNG